MSKHDHDSRSPRALRPATLIFLAALLGLALAAPGLAATCDSTASGSFQDPSNWSCGHEPLPGDAVTIHGGHGLVSTANVTATSLTVESGALLEIKGFSLRIEIQTLDVQPGGMVRGASGANGTTVFITSPPGATMTVRNDGLIRGGSPGGGLFIADSGGGGDLPCPSSSSIESNGGSFQGGSPGNVYLLAATVDLQNASVAGGSGFVPINLFGNSQAGSVYIAGIQVILDGSTFVTSGNNTNPHPDAIGGTVKIVAQSCNSNLGTLFVGPAATVAVGSPAAGGCPGAILYAAFSSTIMGTVAPGPGWCLYWDPPELNLVGDAQLRGEQVILAGSDLDATGLASRTLPTPAVTASGSLEINLAPGGTADFRGLAPGFVYFRAGSAIILRADQVITDPGVALEDLMDPPPDWLRGTATWLLDMPPSSEQFVAPGASVRWPVQITNIGSTGAYVEVTIEDDQGWLAGGALAIAANLAPGEAILRTLTIDVPRKARNSRSTTVTVGASIAGKPPQKSHAVFIMND